MIIGNGPSRADPNRFLINMGEQVVSLRQVLRRYTYVRTRELQPGAFANVCFIDTFSRLPPGYGYDPGGGDLAFGLVVPGNSFRYNYVPNTPLNWVAMCFAGYRGSVNWTINVASNQPLAHVSCSRLTEYAVVGSSLATLATTNGSAVSRWYTSTIAMNTAGTGGMALTNQRTNACLNVANPMYSSHKINTVSAENATAGMVVDDTSGQMLRLHVIWDSTVTQDALVKINYYAAAGTDFSLYMFLNVPTLFRHSVEPNPA